MTRRQITGRGELQVRSKGEKRKQGGTITLMGILSSAKLLAVVTTNRQQMIKATARIKLGIRVITHLRVPKVAIHQALITQIGEAQTAVHHSWKVETMDLGHHQPMLEGKVIPMDHLLIEEGTTEERIAIGVTARLIGVTARSIGVTERGIVNSG
jgi:hypothetical protein